MSNGPKQPRKSTSFHGKNEEKFLAHREQIQKNIEKFTSNYESSSEEEELETENVFAAVTQQFSKLNENDLGRTKAFLEETLTSGAVVCLICIGSVKRVEPIWDCSECFCIFHLVCIQRWSKDSIVHQKRVDEDQNVASKKKIYTWCCPKCRQEYAPNEIPDVYRCFCGKVENPQQQHFLPPHSCGEVCEKPLKPECEHQCTLLCHPGPCPTCPQMIDWPCFCGKDHRVQRCCKRKWGCDAQCKKLLACNRHKCVKICHDGPCPPCPETSLQKCNCGNETTLRECAEPRWTCQKVCNKMLGCGNHRCTIVCHEGECQPCPLTGERRCPCGKQVFELPCTEETPTCGDTCGKLLECGNHQCLERCHRNKCGNCLEVIPKTCRCGTHVKELPCQKEFLCDTKCKQMKDCFIHLCNRKCCDGNCPPCEKPCGRTLRCGVHKCASACHRGPCFPCALNVKVTCRCGETKIFVQCGRQRKTRPPKCKKQCKIPPDCHHAQREKHRCHFGDCAPCQQICNKSRDSCPHPCPIKCHSAILVKITDTEAPSMPWEKKAPQILRQSFPCPDCIVPVSVTCLGLHETSEWPCHQAKVSCCGRQCGRSLSCGNHLCTLDCHEVVGAKDSFSAGTNCERCELMCRKPRPDGCIHPCPKACHTDDCPKCHQTLRVKCYCGLQQVYIQCSDNEIPEKRDTLKTCGNQCTKSYKCGHRCRAICHSGECPDEEKCQKKVKLTCPCRGVKKEYPCDVARQGHVVVECDENCKKKIKDVEKERQLLEQRMKEEEIRRNERELEEFNKKFQSKKKHRERKRALDVEEVSMFQRYKYFLLAFIALLLCVCIAIVAN